MNRITIIEGANVIQASSVTEPVLFFIGPGLLKMRRLRLCTNFLVYSLISILKIARLRNTACQPLILSFFPILCTQSEINLNRDQGPCCW